MHQSSYSYDITSTLQNNLTKPERFNGTKWPFNDRYVWNFHMIAAPLKDSPTTGINRPWLLPLIHGHVDQASECIGHLRFLRCSVCYQNLLYLGV